MEKYLPYVSTAGDGNFKPNAIPEQDAFNATQFTAYEFYYGQIEYECSPMNGVISRFAQGNSWADASRGGGFQYLLNTGVDCAIYPNAAFYSELVELFSIG